MTASGNRPNRRPRRGRPAVWGPAALAGLLTCAAFAGGAEQPPRPLEDTLKPIRARHGLPALAAAVVLDGRTVALGAVGVRKAGSDVPVTREDRFHLGSCTKAMTATLVATLIEEGRLRWDVALPEALPEAAAAMHGGYRTATLLDLLTHRAGLVANVPPGVSLAAVHALGGTPTQQRLAYARMVLAVPPRAPPGQKYFYSNAGYALVGAIAERATGRPWRELMRQRIFRPLGMTTAGFGAMGTPGRIDQPFQHVVRKGRPTPIAPGPRSDNPPAIGPAGRVHCSMADWAKFVAAHLAGARGRPTPLGLKPATWRRLHTPPKGADYAPGWLVTTRPWAGGKVLTHAGSNTMNYAVAWLAPKSGFAALVATNQGGTVAAKACDEVAAALVRRFAPRPAAGR